MEAPLRKSPSSPPPASSTLPREGSFIGRMVANVRVERLLGRGGMAEVYLGHHMDLDRPVAIKILYSHMRDDPMLMQMLKMEAAALVAMKHPNIVHCVDCDVIDGRPYIVMDLLDGITLQARLEHLKAEGLLPPLHVVERIVRSASDALDHAHARGIVHRDLKPASMMLVGKAGPIDAGLPLPQDVQVVLTDFGVARLMDATESPDMIVGTPAYMSPEQAAGAKADIRSDIYSRGSSCIRCSPAASRSRLRRDPSGPSSKTICGRLHPRSRTPPGHCCGLSTEL
jgi:serine/threonine-protein kinase